ncbi:PhoU family transcriptional regulator [Halobiforma lacisalsi AJ5]|uniref:PhoU family transcriptional regulator n=1 Tax=Natronobacterium lacisalsi AJ5 TaxID=358396 RepID=M0LGQ3_NATLA|nr:phosphate uptake regulator PhoU [Halobiforma lacisalsi]APW99472.1 PhoU family transcriptional regulator [Halobiforma lacisalsi AJ5]EMA31589.1 phosphate uptake regulator PhoU [Halobiforma lacisalsi AJ5]
MSANRTPDTDDVRTPVERKVQIAGNSTFVVSLPKEWATEQGLESGSSMFLYPLEDRLVAAAGTVSCRDRSVAIDAEPIDDESVLQRARAAYLAGYDRITVENADALEPDARRTLERAIGRLVGMEIETVAADALTATSVLDVGEVSLPQTVAQARQLALEMHEDAVRAVRDDDEDLARRVIGRDDDVDRLFAFVSRGFHRGLEDVHEIDRLGTDRTAAFRQYRIARQLERVADHAERIAEVPARQSSPPEAELADRLETIGGDARRVVELALADEIEPALSARSEVRRSISELDRRLYDRGGSDAFLYGTVLRSLERTAEIGGNVARATAESTIDE